MPGGPKHKSKKDNCTLQKELPKQILFSLCHTQAYSMFCILKTPWRKLSNKGKVVLLYYPAMADLSDKVKSSRVLRYSEFFESVFHKGSLLFLTCRKK
uniref:Uncharacterized protein n=1 Tax=Strigamia maritima TaxID=126957 RepID=T1IY78_STRMM